MGNVEPPEFSGDDRTEYDKADYDRWKADRDNRRNEQSLTSDKSKTDEAKINQVDTGRSVAPSDTSKSEVRVQETPEETTPQSYVWLPNGQVLKVNNEDLPTHSGLGAENGYWESDGKVYQIVAVYPVETTIKESK